MRTIFTFVIVLMQLALLAQNKVKATNELAIVGEVKNEVRLSLLELMKLKPVKIDDLTISNHLGEKKGVATKLIGVLVKEVLKNVEIKEENPKLLSTYYLVFTASDGYKVVYSWNEIFNSATGDNTFILVQKDGKHLNEMEDRLVAVTITDSKTGRRFVKGLSKIVIQKVK